MTQRARDIAHTHRLLAESRRVPVSLRQIRDEYQRALDGEVEHVDNSRAEADDAAMGRHPNSMRERVLSLRAAGAPPSPAVKALAARPFIHSCRCCGLRFTYESWLKLNLLDAKEVTEDGLVELHDMRNCECGSTLLMISEREKGTGIYYRGGER